MSCEFLSFYIPVIRPAMSDYTSVKNSELEVIHIFDSADIGKVGRVDFVENGDKHSAYVHLDHWYDTDSAWEVYNDILETGSCKIMNGDKSKHLILRRMTCEYIPETEMNIHQLAALVLEQGRRIDALEASHTDCEVPVQFEEWRNIASIWGEEEEPGVRVICESPTFPQVFYPTHFKSHLKVKTLCALIGRIFSNNGPSNYPGTPAYVERYPGRSCFRLKDDTSETLSNIMEIYVYCNDHYCVVEFSGTGCNNNRAAIQRLYGYYYYARSQIERGLDLEDEDYIKQGLAPPKAGEITIFPYSGNDDRLQVEYPHDIDIKYLPYSKEEYLTVGFSECQYRKIIQRVLRINNLTRCIIAHHPSDERAIRVPGRTPEEVCAFISYYFHLENRDDDCVRDGLTTKFYINPESVKYQQYSITVAVDLTQRTHSNPCTLDEVTYVIIGNVARNPQYGDKQYYDFVELTWKWWEAAIENNMIIEDADFKPVDYRRIGLIPAEHRTV